MEKHIDHFTSAALALAYSKNISIEEAQEILFQQTLKLHNEFIQHFGSDPVQE